jgi:predicted Fe-Mo cluster-binding NifX family protein
MKIAVASEGANVSVISDIARILTSLRRKRHNRCGRIRTDPGHKPGYLPNFLADRGVEVMIAGGIGGGAVDIFNERNIEVIAGAGGNAKVAAQAYLDGKLKSTGSVCHEHQHAGEEGCAE